MSDIFGDVQAFATIGDKGTQFAAMNDGVFPEFDIEPVKNEAKTEEAGTAIYDNVEIVRIRIAGDPYSVASTIVDDGIRRRFAAEYARWKAGQDRPVEGTPIKEWAPLSKSQVLMFEAANIVTVEQLATVSDGNISRIPDGTTWRQRAKAFLENARDGAVASKYAAENERLRAKLEELTNQVQALASAQAQNDETQERLHWKTRQKMEREAAEKASAA